ncbi:MAG: hypothetical protein K2K41_01655, partial [Ruminiclostridium sp.]|nr:hypothetical protein [Ruminiclostridium sp.]
REKSMAAYKAGIKTVIIPFENKPDLEDVDDVVKENVRFIPAKSIETVLENALVKDNVSNAKMYDAPDLSVKKPVLRKERGSRKNKRV